MERSGKEERGHPLEKKWYGKGSCNIMVPGGGGREEDFYRAQGERPE
jgi:hypothetical protein